MTWSSSRDPHGSAPPTKLRMWRDDGWLAVAAPLAIFAGHALYGAMLPQTALLLTAVFALLAAACLWRPKLRKELLRQDGLALPAILFGLVVLAALWSLTPFVPGGPHPVWAYLKIPHGAATVDKSATLLEIIKLLGLGCVFVVGLATGGSDSRARLAVNVIIGLGVLFGAWAFLAFVTGQTSGGGRLEASFLTANTAGCVFAVLFFIAIGPVTSRLTAPGVRLSGVAPLALPSFFFLGCLVMTASRGAFAATAAAMLAFGLLWVFSGRLKWSRAALLTIAGFGTVLVLLALMGDLLVNRLLGVGHDFAARATIAKVHWQAFLESPLFGYGLGSFDTVNRLLLDIGSFQQIWAVRAAHNIYLAWLEQAGLLGALPMFGCIAAIVLTTLRKGLRRSRMTSIIFSLVAVDVVYLVQGTTDFALEMFSVAAMFAFLLGLQVSVAQGSSKR